MEELLGRRYNPSTHCYEAPGRKPIPAEHIKFPMNGIELLWLLITFGDTQETPDEQR